MRNPAAHRGFSLYELLMTMTLVALVLTPSGRLMMLTWSAGMSDR